VCVAAAIGFATLAGWLADRGLTALDTWIFERLYDWIPTGVGSQLLGLSTPALPITICAGVAVIGACARRWDVATLAVVAPTLTVLLTKIVFKPLLARTLGTDDLVPILGSLPSTNSFTVTGAFPSGHESAVASAAFVLVIVAFQAPLPRRVRAIALTVIAVWAVLAAVGLVRNFWHYGTDTIGAMLLAVTVVFGLAMLLDRHFDAVLRRLRERRAARVS